MKIRKHEKNDKALRAAALGLLAGFLNGFLGAGGGVLLLMGFRRREREGVLSSKDSFASTVVGVLPLCAVSAAVYAHRGMIDRAALLPYIPSAVAGGLLGAVLTERINAAFLRKIFAVLCIAAGVNMIL